MSESHPFAAFIRILGKGPNLSRDLTEPEALEAMRMVLADRVEPMQLGAFLCLLRVKTESPAEIAGIVRAARETLPPVESPALADLDWPSYAGKTRRLPWFLLAARLLAANGVRVILHGDGAHAPDRLHVETLLRALAIPRAGDVGAAESFLRERAIAYLPLACLQPRLSALLGLRGVLGVRSPLNTALRQLNPLRARHQIIGVAHPAYRDVHRAAAALLGQPRVAIFKGEGGEAERRPEKPCDVHLLRDGVAAIESLPALLDSPTVAEPPVLEPRHVAALWSGAEEDDVARAAVIGTAAIALRLLGLADSGAAADALAAQWWRARRRAVTEAA